MEVIDAHAPHFKIRHINKRFYFPIYFPEPIDSLQSIIFSGLKLITRKTPESPTEADRWMLFTKDLLHIETVEELTRLSKGAELILSPVNDVIVEASFVTRGA